MTATLLRVDIAVAQSHREATGEIAVARASNNLGLLPGAWPIKRVDQLFETQLGKMLSGKARGGKTPKPYLRNKNVQWGHVDVSDLHDMDFDDRERSKFELRHGDLLVCEGGVVGRAALWKNQVSECYYQKALHRLRPLDGTVTNEFMLYWLRFAFEIQNFYGVAGASSTIAHLPAAQLRALEMPVPPLPEQRRIADVLGTLQEAIEQQERLIRTTTELKQALMQKLFTEGLRSEAQKETEIGLVPESWEVVQLQSLADVRGGKRLPKGNSLVPEDTGYPYIRVTDFEDNSVTTEDVLFVPARLQQGIKRYIIHKDDVYISVAGSIGLVGMVPEELDGANLTENANRLVIHDQRRITPRYLMYWLAAEYCQAEIKSQTLKNAQPKLSLGRIKTLAVALPSRKDQDAMVDALDSVRNKIKVANRKKTALQDLFRTLLHELMTGKVKVNLEQP